MKPLYTANDIREMDEQALSLGVTREGMVGAVGNAVADMILKTYPACAVLFFCGSGNNGADGLAAATVLAGTHGVTVFQLDQPRMNHAALAHRERLKKTRARVIDIDDEQALSRALAALSTPTIVVDALLGTGSNRPPEGVYRAAVEAINGLGKHAEVVAIDLATGVCVDSGLVHDTVVQAHHTIALMGYKPAHLLYPAAQYAGGLRLAVPFVTRYQPAREMFWFQREDIQPMYRERGTHKGTYGCLLITAGSRGMGGAGEMCARSALRSGCGTLVLSAPLGTVKTYRQKLTEAMTFELPEDALGGYALDQGSYEQVLKRADAVVLGPGMGEGEGVLSLVEQAVRSQLPVVLDADALNALAKHGTKVLQENPNVVITPHPRELARLRGVDIQTILDDPVAAANEAAMEFNCVCVLKMASTIIASPTRTAVSTTGCAGMAKGGSGDVLAGCLGAMLAQGQEPFYAACLAAHVCGLAGQMAQRHWGMTAMLPTDTIVQLPRVFKQFEKRPTL